MGGLGCFLGDSCRESRVESKFRGPRKDEMEHGPFLSLQITMTWLMMHHQDQAWTVINKGCFEGKETEVQPLCCDEC